MLEDMIIIDCQRNRVNLTERFPQLKSLNISLQSFGIITLSQDICTMIIFECPMSLLNCLYCVIVHVENGELHMSSGTMELNDPICDHFNHIDLTQDSFHHEDFVLYGTCSNTGSFGPIKYSYVENEVMRLCGLSSELVFFDGIPKFYDDVQLNQYFFYLKEKKIVVLKEHDDDSEIKFTVISTHPFSSDEDDFYVFSMKRSGDRSTRKIVKIHWVGKEYLPIITDLPHGGKKCADFLLGLPLCIDYDNLGNCLVYLGNTVILELTANKKVYEYCDSTANNSVCILCSDSLHFLQFIVNKCDVEVQKHFFFEHNDNIAEKYYNPRPMIEIHDHHLFVIEKRDSKNDYLCCLDWSSGNFLEPVLLHDHSVDDNRFRYFVGDACLKMEHGIVQVSIFNGVIEKVFLHNENLPNIENEMNILNLPNDIVQSTIYDEETKTMVLRTFNVKDDPRSTNPTVEAFHIPSFLAEASIVEYHMPNYQART
ncbi:hypothetical protein PCE1_004736 [Barthelona sp. PCE]